MPNILGLDKPISQIAEEYSKDYLTKKGYSKEQIKNMPHNQIISTVNKEGQLEDLKEWKKNSLWYILIAFVGALLIGMLVD